MLIERQRLTHLDLARVFALFFVLLIHSPIAKESTAQPLVIFVRDFIGGGAVPLFFMLSGYLGARKMESPQTTLLSYIRDKTRTLLIPFLFWNLLLLLCVMTVKLTGLDSMLKGEGGYLNVYPNPASVVSAVLGIGRFPLVYQFWFLRDLIVVSLAGFLIRRYLPAIPLLPWLIFLIPVPMASSLGFFYLGSQLHPVVPHSKMISPVSGILYCLCWMALGILMLNHRTEIPFPLLQLGSAAFLFLLASSLVMFTCFQKLASLGGSTFIIYALHEPSQTIIAKIWGKSGLPGYGSLLGFFIVPLMVFPICWLVYCAMRRYFPALLPYMTGGR